MKKIFLIGLLLSFALCNLTAQVKGDAEYLVKYELSFAMDSTNLDQSQKEIHRLYTGATTSLYMAEAYFYTDSIFSLLDKNPNLFLSSLEFVSGLSAEFNANVFKDFNKQDLWVVNTIGYEDFHYKETAAILDWQPTGELKEFPPYTVHKATTSFGGRDYIAWFSIEVPILDGPYIFSGLPGLIVELYDSNKEYWFRLVSFESLEEKYKINLNKRDSAKLSKQEFVKHFKAFKANPYIYLSDGVSATDRDFVRKETEKEQKRNNYIEKW